jgi:hypothetical protein
MNWLAQKIRNWLGITADMELLNSNDEQIMEDLADINANIGKLRRSIEVSQQGLGRVIAKLDPIYGRPETPSNPTPQNAAQNAEYEKRKAESDKLGDEVIKRLKSEQAMQDRYPGGSQGTR